VAVTAIKESAAAAAGERSAGTLDACELGNLGGALVVSSELTSDLLQPLCWRGEEAPPRPTDSSVTTVGICLT
jgi:hypothetical protein